MDSPLRSAWEWGRALQPSCPTGPTERLTKSLSFGPNEGVGQLGGLGRPSAPPRSPSLGVSNRTGAKVRIPALTHDS